MFSVLFNKIFSFVSNLKILREIFTHTKKEKERGRKFKDFRRRSLTSASHGNQTMDTASSIGVMSVMGYVMIPVG